MAVLFLFAMAIALHAVAISVLESFAQTCACSNSPSYDNAVKRLNEEWAEFVQEPSFDEFGDIMFQISMMLMLKAGLPYVLPMGGSSARKGRARYHSHGCCRSMRNKVDHG